MKNKKYIILLLLVFLLLLTGCGNSGNKPKPDPTPDPQPGFEYPDKVANVDPLSIDPGYFIDEDGYKVGDFWYPWDDSGDDYYFYFTIAPDNLSRAGLYFTAVSEGKTILDTVCDYTDAKHLIVQHGYQGDFDFIFIDNFTCYDYVSDSWYIRGDYKFYFEQFAGHGFVNTTNENHYFEFYEDGTYQETYYNEIYKGTWDISCLTNLRMLEDGKTEAYRNELVIDENNYLTFSIEGIVFEAYY